MFLLYSHRPALPFLCQELGIRFFLRRRNFNHRLLVNSLKAVLSHFFQRLTLNRNLFQVLAVIERPASELGELCTLHGHLFQLCTAGERIAADGLYIFTDDRACGLFIPLERGGATADRLPTYHSPSLLFLAIVTYSYIFPLSWAGTLESGKYTLFT